MVTARHRLGFDSSTGIFVKGPSLLSSWTCPMNVVTSADIVVLSFINIGSYIHFNRCVHSIGRRDCLWQCRVWSPVAPRLGLGASTAKRFDGWNSSKADFGRTDGKPKRDRGDLLDRRYVHYSGQQSDRAGQNYDSRQPIRESTLQPPRTTLPPLDPRTWRERRSFIRNQDRLWTRIHWWEPYVWIVL